MFERIVPRAGTGLSLLLSGALLTALSLSYAEGRIGHGHASPAKKNCSSSGACLTETNSGSGAAVQGNAASGNALSGASSTGSGVFGTAGGNGAGVYGTNSSTGSGMYAYSSGGPGLTAQSHSQYGVNGYSTNSSGVFGSSGSGFPSAGVFAYSNAGDGYGAIIEAGANAFTALYAQGPGTADISDIMEGGDSSGDIEFYVDDLGTVDATAFYDEGPCKNGCTKFRHERTYAAQSSAPTLDDVGEATLRDGHAHVALDAALANVVDATKPYVVLLTPEGDGSLYVAGRSSTGFDVAEVGGGRATMSFAYRIVAHPYGATTARLPFDASRKRRSLPRR